MIDPEYTAEPLRRQIKELHEDNHKLCVDLGVANVRLSELEALLRETHDPLVISEALLRKHGYGETADMVKAALDKVCAAVPTTQVQ